MAATQKPLQAVPRSVWLLLVLALSLQIGWQASRLLASAPASVPASASTSTSTSAPASASTSASALASTSAPRLPPAPSTAAMQLAALGEPVALARLTMLYVQGFDEQAGASVSWRDLDYPTVIAWLQRVLDLDPRGQSPLLAASQVYGAVGDPVRTRLMLDFVQARFAEDPNRRWPWLAHAALVARHRLHDLPLARSYAREIRLHATGANVPAWARQLEIFILEDMNQLDGARALIGGLLASGQVTDPRELKFLANRLEQLQGQQPQQGQQRQQPQEQQKHPTGR